MRSQQSYRVFIVDDDHFFAKALEHHLKQNLVLEFAVNKFSNGEECINSMDKNPDIVVLDYFLESGNKTAMNGIQVLKKIKTDHPEVSVIMVSSQDKLQVAVDTMRYGAYDYVVKNENAFLRVENAVRNRLETVYLTNELQQIKRNKRLIFWILMSLVVAAILLQIFFPVMFNR